MKRNTKKGRSRWKFDNSLTQDDAFVQALRNKIPKFYSESSELADPVVKWDYLKYKVRQFAKKYSIKYSIRQNNVELKGMSLRVKELELLLSADSQEICNFGLTGMNMVKNQLSTFSIWRKETKLSHT